MKKKVIAIITARGGSKRIPRKNIRNFCGKPIIAYSIEAALACGLFDTVMVSTDDREIADIAKTYGAEVPFFRSEKTSDDYATTSDVIREVLSEYKKRGQTYDYICCIYPTAPFLTAEKLTEALTIMEEHHPIEVMPVVAFSYPPQRCYELDASHHIQYKYPEYVNSRSQDLQPLYHDAGQFYLFDKAYFSAKNNVTSGRFPIIVPETEVQDIDNENDWQIAELKYKLWKDMLTQKADDTK